MDKNQLEKIELSYLEAAAANDYLFTLWAAARLPSQISCTNEGIGAF